MITQYNEQQIFYLNLSIKNTIYKNDVVSNNNNVVLINRTIDFSSITIPKEKIDIISDPIPTIKLYQS